MPTRSPQRRIGTKAQTIRTYTTETGAKKAAAGAYGPAIVQLANGRYAWAHAGLPSSAGRAHG
jgi:hypothetical protein